MEHRPATDMASRKCLSKMEGEEKQRERGTDRHVNAVGLSEAWLPEVTTALIFL